MEVEPSDQNNPNAEPASDIGRLVSFVRRRVGNETFESLKEVTAENIRQGAGTGDMPPDYNRDQDPVVGRWREIAEENAAIVIATTLGVTVVGGAIVYFRRRKSRQSETADDSQEA